MKKILVICTGGTISSETFGGVNFLSRNESFIKNELIDKYLSEHKVEHEFEIVSPINILSENINLTDMQKLLDCIYAVDCEKYSGIIVVHGSDTLAYSSALLGFAFSVFPIPIVLTASDLPLSDKNSNGLQNFHSAVCIIKAEILRGVFTTYRSKDGVNQIHLATRITPADPRTDEFGSFGDNIFAKIVGNEVVFNLNPQNPNIMQLRHGVKTPRLNISRGVLMLEPYPGIDYSRVKPDGAICAVLHTLYHSSTAPVIGSGLLSFIKDCKEKNIDFYILPLKPSNAVYESSAKLLQSGAIPLCGLSAAAAFAKLTAAYAQSEIGPQEYMKQNIFFELIR